MAHRLVIRPPLCSVVVLCPIVDCFGLGMVNVTNLGRLWTLGCLAAVIVGLAGCQTVYEVKVDAINNPEKPGGTSYRLEVQDSGGGVDKELRTQAVASVHTALASRGLFEAPGNTKPDMVINVEYGVGPGEMKIIYQPAGYAAGRALPEPKPILVFEKFLSLSAREVNASAGSSARADGKKRASQSEEVWSVRVSVEDPKKELAPYLPVLANSSIDYIGQNSRAEVYLRVVVDSTGNIRSRPESAPSR